MIAARLVQFLGLMLALWAVSPSAPAEQAPSSGYAPSVGQEGKDVVWVPTPQALVEKMLDLAKVTPKDYVIDLGSGDGRTVITAAKRGARALGVEYNPHLVALSRRNAAKAGVVGKARFINADLFDTDLSRATVITMFLLQSINMKLRPKLLDLEPGTRIVSNTFDLGDWKPDETVTLDESADCQSYCTAHFWIVPAKVEGTHKVEQGELSLQQHFQMLSGTLRSKGRTVPVEGKIAGEQVVINAGGRELHGKVNGKRLELFEEASSRRASRGRRNAAAGSGG